MTTFEKIQNWRDAHQNETLTATTLKNILGAESLHGANLSGANLRYANLSHADLSGANLDGTKC